MEIDDQLIDNLFARADASPRKRMHLDLRDSAADTSQRMMNALLPGTVVPIHQHANTSETVVVLKGRLDEVYYDADGRETERHRLDAVHGPYALQIPAGVLHTVHVEAPCVIIEFKNGRYEAP